jgi:hypothetical protein
MLIFLGRTDLEPNPEDPAWSGWQNSTESGARRSGRSSSGNCRQMVLSIFIITLTFFID